MPLRDAIAWREAGFSSDEVRQLLERDWTLSPAEAAAFEAAGITGAGRLEWIEAGFDAASARAWTDVGVPVAEARVWRAVGQGPDEARSHLAGGGGRLPPGWSGWAWSKPDGSDWLYSVVDPPGTRGRTAETAAWHAEERDRPEH